MLINIVEKPTHKMNEGRRMGGWGMKSHIFWLLLLRAWFFNGKVSNNYNKISHIFIPK